MRSLTGSSDILTKRARRYSGAEILSENRVLEKEKGRKGRLEGVASAQKAAFCAGFGGSKAAQNGRFVQVFRLKGESLRVLFSVIFLYSNALRNRKKRIISTVKLWPSEFFFVILQRTSRRRRVSRRNPGDCCDVGHVASDCNRCAGLRRGVRSPPTAKGCNNYI